MAIDLEQWITDGGAQGRVLILRHDVDQHPATAVRMAKIDARHGVRATWYFRWRTSSPLAIQSVRELGGGVGFHYESLTRLALERGLSANQIDERLIETARNELRQEIDTFKLRFGPVQSICAHGDTRVPGVSNQVLVRGQEPWLFGVEFDANEALARHRLGLWMTDRSTPDGGWEHGVDALEVLGSSNGPVLCLTHPNNWCSGVSLWSDRLYARVLPNDSLNPRGGRLGMRTGRDRPPRRHQPAPNPPRVVPAPQLRLATAVRPFGPVGQSLRREILRYYYDTDRRLVSDAGLRTLETNSGLAEARAATIEDALAYADLWSLRDLEVLDLGCGFGALALVFATRGARVSALDPNGERQRVGASVASEHALPVSWLVGSMEASELGDKRFDVVVMNNSLCYLVERASRRAALAGALRALRPGGVLVIRNPNRVRPRDQFTGWPLLGVLPLSATIAITRLFNIERSRVRLLSRAAAKRELRRAGFAEVRAIPQSRHIPLAGMFAAYQQFVARRPVR